MTSIPMAASKTRLTFSRAQFQRRKVTNWLMLSFTGLLTILALLPLFWIIGYVIYKGGQYINLSFFTKMPLPMGVAGGGVLNSIEGTVILTILSAVFAIPPGVLAAFYVAYKPNTTLGVLVRFGTDVLAGVPSIVLGLFIYALIVKTQKHFSAFAGGIALAILMLPTIIRTTEEMLKLVPQPLRGVASRQQWRGDRYLTRHCARLRRDRPITLHCAGKREL
jgi:phosphate transport system permease protein